MQNLLVTIGITAYNAAETIEKAVRSALSQTWRPIEIVVVDDCSTDGTWEVLTRLAEVHNQVRIFRNQSNRGVAYTRNRIVAKARGEFIAFFDDDDISLPERVQLQLERILSYERDFAKGAPVVSYTARRVVYPDGRLLVHPTMGERKGVRAPHGYPVAERILLGFSLKDGFGACPTCSQMIRRDVLRELGGFDPAFRRSEDTELNVRLAKEGTHFVGIAKPVVVQKMIRTSDKSLRRECYYTLKLLKKHRDVPDRHKMYDFCRYWILMKHSWLEGNKVLFVRRMGYVVLRYPWHAFRRLALAIPNFGINYSFLRFYKRQ